MSISAKRMLLALVTAPNEVSARRLARAALKAKLVACANLIPRLESHYRWKGKLECAAEVLILFKTTRARQAALENLVLALHPYDTPEFILLGVDRVNERYLHWWAESCR